MSKYAPAREDGLKPFVRTSYHFGETTESIVYADSAAGAKHMYSRMHLETIRVRRATVEDVARIGAPEETTPAAFGDRGEA